MGPLVTWKRLTLQESLKHWKEHGCPNIYGIRWESIYLKSQVKDDPLQELEKYVDTQEVDLEGTKCIFKLILDIGKKNKLLIKILRLILSWMLGEVHSNL